MRKVSRIKNRDDLFFAGALFFTLTAIIIFILNSFLVEPFPAGGARRIDLVKVKEALRRGELSAHEAIFYRRVPAREQGGKFNP